MRDDGGEGAAAARRGAAAARGRGAGHANYCRPAKLRAQPLPCRRPPPQITSANIELASVTPEHGYRMYTRAQLDAVIAKAQEEMAAEGAR